MLSHKQCFWPISISGEEKIGDVPSEWLDMSHGCISEVRRQVQAEIDASFTYLAMGAHFSQDTINRPGFAEFFFKAAGEEREHATKLIEYLLMRGELKEVTDLIRVNVRTNFDPSTLKSFVLIFCCFIVLAVT